MFEVLLTQRFTYGQFSQVNWLPAVFCVICAVFYTATVFYYQQHMFSKTKRSWPVTVGAYVAYGIVCALIAFLYARAGDDYLPYGRPWDEILLALGLILSLGGRLALAVGVYKEELWDAFWVTVRLSLILFMSAVVVSLSATVLQGGIVTPYNSSLAQQMSITDCVCAINLAFTMLTQLAWVTFMSALTRTRPDKLTLRDWLPLGVGQLFGLGTLGWLLSIDYLTLSGSLAFAVTGILYMNAVLAVYVQFIKTRQGEKEALTSRQYAVQAAYYDRLYQEQENTRSLWHDMSKYLDAMRAAAVTGNGEAAAQVMADAQAAFGALGQVVDVGNPELSAVLQLNVEKARAADVPVKLSAWVPEKMDVALSDLGILLGNTFDNAVEACRALPAEARHIDVTLTCKNDILFYEIKNPYTPKSDGAKADKYHGYGLQNARRAVEKYGGSLTVKQESGLFTVTAYMSFSA